MFTYGVDKPDGRDPTHTHILGVYVLWGLSIDKIIFAFGTNCIFYPLTLRENSAFLLKKRKS